MSKSIKKIGGNFLLLVFILVYVKIFEVLFGNGSIYIAAFSLTAILMFSQINLKLSRKVVVILFPIFFICAVIIPYIINHSKFLWLNMTLILVSLLFFLFFLSPSLMMESYVPFLYLYAINLNTSSTLSLKTTFLAALLGGIATSIVYVLNHSSESEIQNVNCLIKYFKDHLPFIIKVSIGILLAYYIGHELHYVKTSWIILTVISLTEVDLAHTHKKLWQRILATIIGIVIYLVFSNYIVMQRPTLIPIILILVTYVYTFISDYFVKMIFVTFNSINAAVLSMNLKLEQMTVFRFEFIFYGAIIAVIVGWSYHLLQKAISSKSIK